MTKVCAGLLLFRRRQHSEVLLVHHGGPYWATKDAGAWSIPKGERVEDEELLHAARREFQEETGAPAPDGPFFELGYVTYSNKDVYVWAVEADLDVRTMHSARVSLEWPPHSGTTITVPECDRAEWFDFDMAKHKLVKGQVPLIDRLAAMAGV